MSPLTLTLRARPAHRINLSTLIPEHLAGLDAGQIGGLPLTDGLRVADLFEVEAGDAQQLRIRNSCNRLTHVGAAMHSGTLKVEGNCGSFAGLGLDGGRLEITGNAGDFAGCGMKAGTLHVRGDAGDSAGGPLAGDRLGMRGGVLVIDGDAGDRTGERMRRGLLLVGGDAGAYCGANMLAGTIYVAGNTGTMPGFSLKRGTLLLARTPAHLPATFQDSGEHALLFLTLLEKQLQREPATYSRFLPLPSKVRRYCGDMAWGGTGEILVFA